MRLVRLLRDFLLVHRRAVAGMCILIAAGVLLALFSGELEGFYRDLFQAAGTQRAFLLSDVFGAACSGVSDQHLSGVAVRRSQRHAVRPCRRVLRSAGGSLLAAAIIAFVFARYFFRSASRRIAAKVLDLDRLEARLAKHGWRYALMIRASPIAPFGITSYGLGLMPITLREYLLTTLAALPFLFVCVYFGSVGDFLIGAAGEIDRGAIGRLAVAFSAATVLLGIVILFLLPKFIRRMLGPHPERDGFELRSDFRAELRPDLGPRP